jgi:predicted transcriptional regulator
MNVSLTSEQELRLSELAEHAGVSVEQMVNQAVEQMLDQDRRFREAVQVGIDAADRGELIDHADVWAHIEATQRV